MSIPVKLSCPLGHKCEEARDGAIHRCSWFVRMLGRNPQTGEDIDEFGCAIAWTPVLLVENAGAIRSNAAAVESFRNDMTSGNQHLANTLLAVARQPEPKLING